MTTSSFGSTRARRKAKAQADTDTIHRLWVARIGTLMETQGCTPEQALALLSKEVPSPHTPPQRKAQELAAWASFNAAINRLKP
jgi:hypothetical protein